MNEQDFTLSEADGPTVAAAIHAGHALSPEAACLTGLDEGTRLREEDPYTDRWLPMAPTRLAVHRSRFEVDLNRPPETAVYLTPDQAWGLSVWRQPPPEALIARSLQRHADFYARVAELLDRLLRRHARIVVFDLHSYCHRRGGPDAAPDDPGQNPEINLGTASVAPEHRPLVERLAAGLAATEIEGRHLDVRENVKFKGGHFPRWINGRYGARACAIAVEVKKFFMDEWTGQAEPGRIDAVGRVLAAAAEGVERELSRR